MILLGVQFILVKQLGSPVSEHQHCLTTGLLNNSAVAQNKHNTSHQNLIKAQSKSRNRISPFKHIVRESLQNNLTYLWFGYFSRNSNQTSTLTDVNRQLIGGDRLHLCFLHYVRKYLVKVKFYICS